MTHTPRLATHRTLPVLPQSGNSCYKSSGTSGSHNTVRSVCQRQGGDLTSIHSDAENRFVSSVGSFQNAHIGARDEGSEGNWYWDDGSSWDYSKWDPGEPNNCGCAPNGPEHCGHLWRNWGDYKGWNDIWCDEAAGWCGCGCGGRRCLASACGRRLSCQNVTACLAAVRFSGVVKARWPRRLTLLFPPLLPSSTRAVL